MEERLGEADPVRLGDREPFPARGRLVGEIADARRERDRQRPVGRALREHRAERLERIAGWEPVDLGVVAVEDRGRVAGEAEDPAADADHRVAAVPGAALDAFEDEGETVAQPQRGRHRRDRVGRELEGGDAFGAGPWERDRHRDASGCDPGLAPAGDPWRWSTASR